MPAETAAAPPPTEADATHVTDSARTRIRAATGRWESLLVGLILIVLIAGSGLSDEFLTTDSFTTGLLDLSEVALMALPLVLVIIAAEIDLSVASVLALSSSLMAATAGTPEFVRSRAERRRSRSASPTAR